ncbi:MAG: NADH-quinone oxidoreductase subunit L [SAR202 cluster bacterium MP-SInd-SRR3963457-G2]|nr:MAG: NADH-quinone oxidoreductase subunit L [SAR202 cluster bacterium MP-SInd-SRR3963457-G2]
MVSEASIWAILLLPLAAFVVIGLVVRPFLNRYAWVSGILLIIALAAALALSVLTLDAVIRSGEPHFEGHRWLDVGGAVIEFALLIDPLTAIMLVVVTGVSLMVQIYSLGYMRGDPSYARYFAYMALFTASMLGLVLSANIILLYAFWELVGVSSYLLIGFWHERPAAAAAAKKAFLITRIGDVGFLIAIMYLFLQGDRFAAAGLNPFHIPDIWQAAQPLAAGGAVLGGVGLTWLTLGIFSGAMGKSGQFPLHTWLPDAMEGPTPVSSLIHAATMVAAGVFLVARFYPVFQAAQHVLTVVALVGGFTALFAATMGLVMNDIKRVMAYSTVSQLGYMMAALGLGAFPAAIFHLVTHASFKALLFMVAGNVNHATGTFNMRYMGGLWRRMPLTYALVLIGGLSLVGIIPLAGFWSKDEILSAAWSDGWHGGGPAALWAGKLTLVFLLTGVLLTAFYTFRMIYMTFHGEFRGGAEQERADLAAEGQPDTGHLGEVHLAESPIFMWFPMVLLGVAVVFSGYLLNPQWVEVFGIPKHWITEFLIEGLKSTPLGGVVHLEVPAFNRWMVAASTVIALAGIGLASVLYLRRSAANKDPLESIKPVHTLLSRKYFLDELYEDVIVRRSFHNGIARVVDWVDRVVVDGVVDAIGSISRNLGPNFISRFQTGEVQAYGIALTLGSLLILLGFLVF